MDLMAKYHKEWARNARFQLMFQLGGACCHCQSEDELEFDCKIPQGDEHHKMDTSARMSFYRRQHKEGNLQILCRRCNNKKSVSDLAYLREKAENEPF